jgi:hypothetical protein
MSKDIKCPKCGSEDIYYSKKNDAECCCMKCLSPFLYISKPMTDEQIAKLKNEIDKAETHLDPYPQARGFDVGNDQYTAPRPLPCVRDEHGEIREQSIKALLSKIDEELNELKEEIYGYLGYCTYSSDKTAKELLEYDFSPMIAEEAADTITAITTMLEALGIDREARDEAQRRVNAKNRERGRL